MGVFSTFSKYAWIPYLFLCVGLVVLFGTEEWLLFNYKTPNEVVISESKLFANHPLEIFRRALNELDEDEINLLYSAALTAGGQTRPVTAAITTQSQPAVPETKPDLNAALEKLFPKPDMERFKNFPKPPPQKPSLPKPPQEKLTISAPAAPAEFEHAVLPQVGSHGNSIQMNHLGSKFNAAKGVRIASIFNNGPLAHIAPIEERGEIDENGVYLKAVVSEADVHRATTTELKAVMPALDAPPLNPRFVFHNKIPKAGSTTMKWLLVGLAKRNNFELDHQRWCIDTANCVGRDPVTHIQYDGPDGEKAIADYVPKKLAENESGKYLLLKHHHWFNFSDHGVEMPTYINIARDPVTRFASWYYFERFGWERQEGQRDKFTIKHGDDQDDKDRTLDDCVLGGYNECLEPVQVLVKYFCGTVQECSMMGKTGGHDWRQVAIATERAKRIIARHFHVVGVLENFEQTLALFEKMLPGYFSGAKDVYNTPVMAKQRESSKSHHQTTLNETRYALEHGVLRYEVDIYNLVKTLFYEKLQFYNIPLPTV